MLLTERTQAVCEMVGAALLVVGVGMWSIAAALVVAGVLLIAVGNVGGS